jgi:hypothetical protein
MRLPHHTSAFIRCKCVRQGQPHREMERVDFV